MDGSDRIHPATLLLWLAILAGIPALVAAFESGRPGRPAPGARPVERIARTQRPPTSPPALPAQEIYALDTDTARDLNSKVPFTTLPNPSAQPFRFSGSPEDLARATDCLAAAQLYEAGDDARGEEAVAQVVLNRVRHPAFPKTVCGVVFQGQERRSGCQFTFTCDGALARTPSTAAWERAREIARAALAGKVFKPVGYATHYHTDWVVPYWSGSLDKITAVGTHLFFRWRGWWGTPPAFGRGSGTGEPLIERIARLSDAHRAAAGLPGDLAPAAALNAAATLAAQPQRAIDAGSLGTAIAGARLTGIAPGGKAFLVELNRGRPPQSWPTMAETFCAGRSECRIMAWTQGRAPSALPLSAEQMASMAFAYIHNVGSGLQRSLWNCAIVPRANPAECMRARIPAPSVKAGIRPPVIELDGVRRRDRFETVKIAPLMPPPAVAGP